MSLVFFNTNGFSSSVPLQNFNDTPVVMVRVPAGKYVVFGKVQIQNVDGDAQNASVRLTSEDGAKLIDQTDVRVAKAEEGNHQSVSVQGVFIVAPGDPDQIVDLRCATFRGAAFRASVIAMSVDNTFLSPPA